MAAAVGTAFKHSAAARRTAKELRPHRDGDQAWKRQARLRMTLDEARRSGSAAPARAESGVLARARAKVGRATRD